LNDPLEPQDDAGTPLTEEEKEGLIPSYITLRSELNEAEQENILEAQEWALARKREVLDEKFLKELHRRMYRHVWQWAGEYRKTAKNVGDVDAYRIPTELRGLLDDCRYWIEHETYEPDGIAARFHHGLVFIHCYPNGNGRHARIAADLLLRSIGCEPFSWGRASLTGSGETRDRYMAALRAADEHDYGPLLEFVRS
jgi:Fic-DOC domain mobile mystery protein B